MWILLQLTVFFVFMILQGASAQNDCGNTSFSGSEGVVTSPNFPLPYPHNLSCTYSIDVGRNNSILLKFLNFDLESPFTADFCMHDWLMITCNETEDENLDFSKRYCGRSIPRTSLRFFNCPVVELKFFADSSVNGGGFSIEYTVFANFNHADNISALDCGETVFTGSAGVIRLPENPTDYPASVKCTYTISTNYSSRIELSLATLSRLQLFDSFADCNRDNVTVGCLSDRETELNPNTSNTYCRSSLAAIFVRSLPIVFSNCRVLKISIRSSDYNYRGSYGIPFEVHTLDEECGTTSFTGPTGIVTSPRFPLTYPHSLDCVYTIEIDRTKTVTLDFISFRLEGTSHSSGNDDCSYDWLTVSCLSDDSVPAYPNPNRKYCGDKVDQTKPMTFRYSNCNSLTLNFVTDSSVAHGGFQFRYTITSEGYTAPNTTDEPDEGCGNTSFTGPVGFISSPRFPLSYPNSLDCIYSIDVDRTKMVVLRFLSFNIEGTSHVSYLDSCNYDWLMISCLSNGPVSGLSHGNRKYCGEKATPLILGYSNCDSMTLNFVTDSSVTSGGFQLRYRITSADESDCGDTLFSGPYGIVTSPNYPFRYPHNMSCAYSIDVGRNNSVLLKFKHFGLETSNSTGYCSDWLMISCNETTKANPSYGKKYCGAIQWVSSMLFVDCPSLVLEFFSDSSINGEGFVIEYTVVENSNFTDDFSELDCGATLFTNSSGVISLPRNPTNFLATVNCTYTILTNQMSYIWLETYLSSSSQLLNSFRDCTTDSLTVGCASEGETDLNANTTRVICRQGRPAFYYSSRSFVFADCGTLKLSIRSTNYDNRETFRIPFSVYEQSEICGNTSFSAPSGVISSRRLPWDFSHGVNCLYTIDSGHVNSVVLILDRVSFGYVINRNASCNSGWLTITCLLNGTSMAHPIADRKLCGLIYPTTERFPACRSVLFNYSSNYIASEMGFSIRYRMGDYDPECGNTSYSGPNGFVTSPMFPLSYAHNLNCLYSITGGQRKTIYLSFLAFHLEGTSNTPIIDSCYSDWLTVTCLSDQSATANVSSSRRYCGYKTTLRFTFPNCEVVGLNFRSDSSVTHGGFKVRYTVTDTDSLCGVPVYDRPSGVISFPWNNTDLGVSIDCNSLINATEPSSISLTIWSISLQSSVGRNCQSDWLLITCINGQTALDHKVSHRTCDQLNSSTQLTFPSCAAAKVVNHRDSESAGKTFRIEYTVTSSGESILTTELPTTSVSPTTPVTAATSCATGCKLSPDATYCECLPDTSQTPKISVSTENPVTGSGKCEVGCKISADGTTCDCSTTQSGDAIVDVQKGSSGNRGRAIGISLTVILVVAGAICLSAFLIFRRQRKKNRSEMLIQASEIEERQLEMEDDTSKGGSMFGANRNQDRDSSKYLPLRPMSLSDHVEPSSKR